MIASGSQAQTIKNITVNVENDAVRRYMEEVQYLNREDTSLVQNYAFLPNGPYDIPAPAIVPIPPTRDGALTLLCSDSADFVSGHLMTFDVEAGASEKAIYNLVPQQTYYYKVLEGDDVLSQGEIYTEGQVRMIRVPEANNIRDFGGWKTADGKRIKYGKLFRGTELNGRHPVDSADLVAMQQMLDIKAELDLRAWYDTASNISAFGFKTSYTGNIDEPPYYYTSGSGQLLTDIAEFASQYRWRRQFSFIVNNLKRDRNVYIHCVWGADRTGYLSLFLEGLLGVDYDGLVKDYELTSFYSPIRAKTAIDPVIDTIMTFQGNTLKEKFNTFFLRTIKNSQAEIDFFREAMLEDVKGSGDEGGPTTAIQTAGRGEATCPPAIYDLRGRRLGRATKRGIVIEKGSDGKTRKIIL